MGANGKVRRRRKTTEKVKGQKKGGGFPSPFPPFSQPFVPSCVLPFSLLHFFLSCFPPSLLHSFPPFFLPSFLPSVVPSCLPSILPFFLFLLPKLIWALFASIGGPVPLVAGRKPEEQKERTNGALAERRQERKSGAKKRQRVMGGVKEIGAALSFYRRIPSFDGGWKKGGAGEGRGMGAARKREQCERADGEKGER